MDLASITYLPEVKSKSVSNLVTSLTNDLNNYRLRTDELEGDKLHQMKDQNDKKDHLEYHKNEMFFHTLKNLE